MVGRCFVLYLNTFCVAVDTIDDLQYLLIACGSGTVDEMGKSLTRHNVIYPAIHKKYLGIEE